MASDPRSASSHDGVDPRWGIGDAVAGFLLALVVPSVVIVIGLAVAGVGPDEVDEIPLWAVAVLQVPLWFVLLGWPLRVSRTKGTGSLRDDFGFWGTKRDVWVGLLYGFVGQIALGIVLLPLYDLLGIDQDEVGQAAEDLADRADDLFGVVCLFLVAVVGAALFEELFYRGLVLRAIAMRLGSGPAIAISSLVFGIVHFQLFDTIALSLFGALCGWLAVRYGRLGPAIWAHAAFNLTAFISLLAS